MALAAAGLLSSIPGRDPGDTGQPLVGEQGPAGSPAMGTHGPVAVVLGGSGATPQWWQRGLSQVRPIWSPRGLRVSWVATALSGMTPPPHRRGVALAQRCAVLGCTGR